jgi:hypothetical protein
MLNQNVEQPALLLGAHTSASGGLHRALEEGKLSGKGAP